MKSAMRLPVNGQPASRVCSERRLRQAVSRAWENLEHRRLFAAVVSTDLLDYAPGSTAHITARNDAGAGTNFNAGETAQFRVLRINPTNGTEETLPGTQPWRVTDGVWSLDGGNTTFAPYVEDGVRYAPDLDKSVDGSFETSWYVDPVYIGATLELKATGLTSGAAAQTQFTDGNVKIAAAGNYTYTVRQTLYERSAGGDVVKQGYPRTDADGADTVGVGNSESLRLDASETATGANNTTLVFKRWVGLNGAPFEVVPQTGGKSIIIPGFGQGTRDYRAEYSAAPAVARSQAAVAVNEGVTATNTGTWSDADAGDTVTLSASVGTVTKNANGTWSWSCATTDGPGQAQTVTITADDGTTTTSTTFALVVNNVAPTATLGNGGNVTYGGSVTVSFANALDPSGVDADAGFRYAFALSPGGVDSATYATSSTEASVSYADLNAGTYTIYGRVFDKDGGFTQYSTGVTVHKANAIIGVSGYTGTYDGNPHGATGTAKGVNGETLAGLDLGASFTNVPGGTANWKFTDATGNYNDVSGSVAITITPKQLTAGFTAAGKVYDGSTSAAITGRALSGIVGGDDVSLGTSGAATFADKNVGTNKLVTGTGFTLTGASAGNYVLAGSTLQAGATITPKHITGSFTAQNKVYDGNTSATVATRALNDPVAGDAVNLDGGGATFGDRNVGTGKTVTLAGATLGGADADNYVLDSVATATANITARAVAVTADAQNKVYGNADPDLGYQVTGGSLVSGDSFSGALTRAAGENVDAYAIQQGSLTAGSNYDLTFVGNTLTIGKATLSVAANPQTKVYGAADPVLGYAATGFKNGDTASVLSGHLTREAGEDVGNYAISLGTLSAGGNYTIAYTGSTLAVTKATAHVVVNGYSGTYDGQAHGLSGSATGVNGVDLRAQLHLGDERTSAGTSTIAWSFDGGRNYFDAGGTANIVIARRAITVTADAQNKVYGNADPALTFEVTSGSLVTGESFGGSLTRDAGENVGQYHIKQGTLTAGSNYDLAYVGANLTVSARAITITPVAGQTKTYGDVDPVLTYASSEALLPGNAFSGALGRAAGQDVGSYPINLGSLSAGSNYAVALAATPVHFQITPRTVTVTADPKGKTYGEADPALTYSGTLLAGDSFTGSLTREAGENVGKYAIHRGTLTAGSNYTIDFVGADLTVTPRAVTVTADAKQKIYGNADPALTYQVTSGTLVSGDAFSGSLSRAAGENVGQYDINQGTLTLGANYTLGYTGAKLTIDQRAITVTADAKSKVYGQADPALTYKLTGGSLVGDDEIVGTLSRVSGENVGTYGLQQGSLTAGSNYALSYVGADLTVTPAPLTVAADAKSKTYGNTFDAFTGTITGVVTGDTITVAYSSAGAAAGAATGIYAIAAALGGSALSNYEVVSDLTNVGTLTIERRALTVTASNQGKTYGDNANLGTTAFTTHPGGLVNGDTVTGVTLTSTGAAAAANVGTYAIIASNAAGSGLENYTISYASGELAVNLRAITVAAHAQTKVYGSADPELTYAVTLGNLVNGDTFTGGLTRAAGETVLGGPYAITRGTLALSGNYDLHFTGANLSITPKVITGSITADHKVYDATTAATIQRSLDGVVDGDSVTLSGTGTFADKNVGNGKTVTASNLSLGGAHASNYLLESTTATTTADITPLHINGNFTAADKVYDGATAATVTGRSLNGVTGGDVVSLAGGTATFADKNAGTDKRVTGTGFTLAGGDAGNYVLDSVASTTADISRLSITGTITAGDKTYDGSTSATITGRTLTGVIAGDVVSYVGGTATFADANAGADKTVTATGLSLAGADAANYIVNTTAQATADIAKADAAVAVSGYTGAYDGQAHGATGSATGVIGEDLSSLLDLGDSFTNVPGGTANWTFAGNGNYNAASGSVAIVITQRAITVTADSFSKYAGEADPALTYRITSGSLVAGESLTGSLTRAPGEFGGSYAIGQGTVASSGNYALTFVGGTLTIDHQQGTAVALPDASCGGGTALVVTGTGGNDRIHVTPTSDGYLVVTLNGATLGRFRGGDIDRLVAYGLGGDDWIQIAGAIGHNAWIYGDDGNDYLNLGAGGGIAFGGRGNDELLGGGGRDVLVGGDGADRLIANAGEDILIAGYTAYDDRVARADHIAAWCSIWLRWASRDAGFSARVASLQGTLAGYFLSDATVHDDADGDQIDMLNGSAGEDWYVYRYGEDKVTGMSSTESKVGLTIT